MGPDYAPSARYKLAYDHRLAQRVLRGFWRALMSSYRRRACTAREPAGQTGAVTFVQRFGSSLNLNLHFHTLCLDGVFQQPVDDEAELEFTPLPAPSDSEVAEVLAELVARLRPVLEEHGLVDDLGAEDALSQDEPLLAACYAGAVAQTTALGARAGQRPARLGAVPGADWVDKHLRNHAEQDGFDLHASVHIEARSRDRLEQLLRYCARPPLSHDRLCKLSDGRLLLKLKTPWFDGTSHLLLQPEELLQRLVALIPRPHKNLLVYHGVLAPNAHLRPRVIAHGRPASEVKTHDQEQPQGSRYNGDWARLMRRAFELDVLSCPRCCGRLRVLSLIEQPQVAQRILRHLGLRDHAPPIHPANIADDFDAA